MLTLTGQTSLGASGIDDHDGGPAVDHDRLVALSRGLPLEDQRLLPTTEAPRSADAA